MRTPRTMLVAALAALAVVAGSGPAAAQQALVDMVAAAVEGGGVFLDGGADADMGDLVDAVEQAEDAGLTLGVAVLADDPEMGADLLAEEVLDDALPGGTMIVLTPVEVQIVSDVFDDATVDAVLDDSIDGFRAGAVPGVDAAVASMLDRAGATSGADGAPEESADAGGGFPWGIVVVVLVVGGIVAAVVLANRNAGRRRDEELQEARDEIRSQLTVVGERIFDLDSDVSVSGDATLEQHYEEAVVTFRNVQEELDQATDHVALADLARRVDHARWQLEVVEATVAGRPVPPEPDADAPSACFFDPDHRAATETATVRTSAGEAEVKVCAACADRLRAGDRPAPRDIRVGGAPVPAPRAPRSHGGAGHEWLGDAFEVLLPGMASGAAYEMRRQRSRTRTRRTSPPAPIARKQPTKSRSTRSSDSRGSGGRSLRGGKGGGGKRGRGGRKL